MVSTSRISQICKKYTTPRSLFTQLGRGEAFLPIILLESTVTSGRTYQAYVYGGKDEAKERIIEESTAAAFWLGGIQIFNKLGDLVGQRLFKIKDPTFSLSKDNVRRPFSNILRLDKLSTEKKLILFKTAKIGSSVLLTWGLVGLALPILKQKLSKYWIEKRQREEAARKEKASFNINETKNVSKINAVPSFGMNGIALLGSISNSIENNAVAKLLTTDGGVLTGRAVTARNKDERIDLLSRDVMSMYFYLACVGHVRYVLNKYDGFGGKLTAIDPDSVHILHKHIMEKFKNSNVSMDEFKKIVLGFNPELTKQGVGNVKFHGEAKNGYVITLEEFLKTAKDEKIKAKAIKMAELQPETALDYLGYEGKVGRILTKQQVFDVLNDGVISDAKVLKELYQSKFGNSLTDIHGFISHKEIQNYRESLDNYVNVLIEYANKSKNAVKVVNGEIITKVKNKNLRRYGFHIISGLAIAAAFLSTIIPKIQYYIRKKRTGTTEFPGTRDLIHKK